MAAAFQRLLNRNLTLRISVRLVLVVSLLSLPALLFFGWFGFALLVLVGLILVAAALYLHDSTGPTRHSVEASAALLSSVALLAAGYWYFIERPRVPKLVPHPAIEAWPIGDGMALVRVSLGLENVGGTAIELHEDDLIEIEVGQVLPPGGKQYRTLEQRFRSGRERREQAFGMIRTDQWPLRAFKREGVEIVIEADETESQHYKAIVPCEPGLRLAVTAKVPKRLHWIDALFTDERQEKLYWVAQGLAANPITDCNKETSDG